VRHCISTRGSQRVLFSRSSTFTQRTVWASGEHCTSIKSVEWQTSDCELRTECRVRDGGRPSAGIPVIWTNTRSALKSEYHSLIGQFPDADAQLKKLLNVLGDIEGVAAYNPASVGNSAQWSAIVNSAEESRPNLCKALSGKTLFSAMWHWLWAYENERCFLRGPCEGVILKTTGVSRSVVSW
jgi:hypothetical protein